MPTNGQAVKIAHYSRSKFNSLANKDSGTIYYVEESNGEIKQYIGNVQVVSDTNSDSVFYIAGTGKTAGTWLGSHSRIDKYYDGLMIAYKIPVAGAETTTLNINGLGGRTVKRNNINLTTHLPVNTVVLLTYTTIDYVGCWVWADYNTYYDLGNIAETTTYKKFTATDQTKLNGIETGAQKNVGTNLSQGARNTISLRIDSSTGDNFTIPSANTSYAGLMTSTDKNKLDGIATGAQVNRTIATTTQAQAGTDNTTVMTPLRVKQAISANGGGGGGSANPLFSTYISAYDYDIRTTIFSNQGRARFIVVVSTSAYNAGFRFNGNRVSGPNLNNITNYVGYNSGFFIYEVVTMPYAGFFAIKASGQNEYSMYSSFRVDFTSPGGESDYLDMVAWEV